MNTGRFVITLCLLLCGAVAAEEPAMPSALKITSGSTPDSIYSKIADTLIQQKKLNLESVRSGGSIKNLEMLLDGDVDLAIVQSDWAYRWFHQTKRQQESCVAQPEAGAEAETLSVQPFPDLKVVRPLYSAYLQVIARSDIDSLGDLEGRIVAVGKAGSASQFHAAQLFSEAGVEVTCVERGFADGDVFDDDEVAAVVISGRSREGELKDGTHILELSQDDIDSLSMRYPYYVRDGNQLSVPTLLVTRGDVDRDRIAEVTEAMLADSSPDEQAFYEIRTELEDIRQLPQTGFPPPGDSANIAMQEREGRYLQIPLPYHAGACETYQRQIFADDELEVFEIAGTSKHSSYTAMINAFNEQVCRELFRDEQKPPIANLIFRAHPAGSATMGNVKLLKDEEVEFAFALNDCVYDAYKYMFFSGRDKGCESMGPERNLRSVAPIFRSYIQLFVSNYSDISTYRQLVYKDVHTGTDNSATRVHATRVLSHVGNRDSPSDKNWCLRLQQGEVDAVILPAAFRSSEYLARECEASHVKLPYNIINSLSAVYPYYYESDPPGSPESRVIDGKFLTLRLFLMTHDGVQEGRVGRLVQALHHSWSGLQENNEHMFVLEEAVQTPPAPYHDEAKQFYVESEMLLSFDHYWAWLAFFAGLALFMFFVERWESSYNRLGDVEFVARRYGYFQTVYDWLISASTVIFILLAVAAGVVLVVVVIREFEAAASAALGEPSDFLQLSDPEAFTWLFTFILSGYENDVFPNSTLAKFGISILALIGIVGPITVAYSLINHRRDLRAREARGEEALSHRRHVVICGWNDKAPGLIYSLTGGDSPDRRIVVVIAQLPEEQPLKRWNFHSKYVFYYRGDASKRSDLDRVNIKRASEVIILDSSTKSESAGFASALTAFAIRKMNDHAFISVELPARTELRTFAASEVNAIVSAGDIATTMLSNACISDHVLDFAMDAVTFDAHAEWYAAEPAELQRHLPEDSSPRTTGQYIEELAQIGVNVIGLEHSLRSGQPINNGFSQTHSATTSSRRSTAGPLDPLLDQSALKAQPPVDCRFVFAADKPAGHQRRQPRRSEKRSLIGSDKALPPIQLPSRILIVGFGSRPTEMKKLLDRHLPETDVEELKIQQDAGSGLALEDAAFNEALAQPWDRILVLSDHHPADPLPAAEANRVDGQATLLANTIHLASPHSTLIAELQRLENRELIKEAGVDIVVSIPLLVERILGLLTFGYGSASRMLLAMCAPGQRPSLRSIEVAEQDPFAGKPFAELLMTRFTTGRVLGWLPQSGEHRERLRNIEADFETHYAMCPSPDAKDIVQVGDIMVVLDNSPAASSDKSRQED